MHADCGIYIEPDGSHYRTVLSMPQDTADPSPIKRRIETHELDRQNRESEELKLSNNTRSSVESNPTTVSSHAQPNTPKITQEDKIDPQIPNCEYPTVNSQLQTQLAEAIPSIEPDLYSAEGEAKVAVSIVLNAIDAICASNFFLIRTNLFALHLARVPKTPVQSLLI